VQQSLNPDAFGPGGPLPITTAHCKQYNFQHQQQFIQQDVFPPFLGGKLVKFEFLMASTNIPAAHYGDSLLNALN
jgi:hypothetical protein